MFSARVRIRAHRVRSRTRLARVCLRIVLRERDERDTTPLAAYPVSPRPCLRRSDEVRRACSEPRRAAARRPGLGQRRRRRAARSGARCYVRSDDRRWEFIKLRTASFEEDAGSEKPGALRSARSIQVVAAASPRLVVVTAASPRLVVTAAASPRLVFPAGRRGPPGRRARGDRRAAARRGSRVWHVR